MCNQKHRGCDASPCISMGLSAEELSVEIIKYIHTQIHNCESSQSCTGKWKNKAQAYRENMFMLQILAAINPSFKTTQKKP